MTNHENEPLRDAEEGISESTVSPEMGAEEPIPKKKRRWWRVLLILLLILLAMVAAVVVAWYTIPRAVIDANVQSVSEFEESEVAVTPELPPVRNVMNIALFGVDQKKGSVGRSDALLILSIDKDHNKIKLTSIARDSLVPIDGHGEEKITHAWAYGHAKLALKTVNQNFGMNITEYAYVNFEEFIGAIDYLGGLYVDLTTGNLDYLNQNEVLNECKKHYGREQTPIAGTGRQLLNGVQALYYSRDRVDGDSNRTGRQREVLMSVYERVKSQPLTKLPGTVTQMLRLCHTSLSGSELTNLATWALTSSPTVETLSLPNAQIQTWNGVLDKQRGWVRVYDLDAATQLLHNFIYETDVPVTDVTTFVPSTTAADTAEVTTTAEN